MGLPKIIVRRGKVLPRLFILALLVGACRPAQDRPAGAEPWLTLTLLGARLPERVDEPVKLDIQIESRGFDGEPCEVAVFICPVTESEDRPQTDAATLEKITRGLQPDMTHKTVLKGGIQAESVSFGFRRRGEYLIILKIDARRGETGAPAHWLAQRASVDDARIRVLFVEHPPRYEYRFLKAAMLRDPKVLCHCLLLGADENFPQEHTQGSGDTEFDEPIQKFPQTMKELLRYDVVILGDVAPEMLGDETALQNLEAFVSEHGRGLIFISGMKSNPRAYKGRAPLERLLPVDPFAPADRERTPNQIYGYRLTDEGRKHPATAYAEFAKEPDKLLDHWEDRGKKGEGQVGIRWFVIAGRVKSGASVLVEANEGKEGATRSPLFVTQSYGRGRVFWSATDETWLWRYLVGDSPWFYPFWRSALFWARDGPIR